MTQPKTRNYREDLKLPEVAPIVTLCNKFVRAQVALKSETCREAVVVRIGDRFLAHFPKAKRWTILHTSIGGVYALPSDWKEAKNKRRINWANSERTSSVDIDDMLDVLCGLGYITSEKVKIFREWKSAEIDVDYARTAVAEAASDLREAEDRLKEAAGDLAKVFEKRKG